MAISKKNKRTISIFGKVYYWWVFETYDQTTFDGVQVKIVCTNQTHFLSYGLQQSANHRKVVLALQNYAQLVHLSNPPLFEDSKGIITNSGIRRLMQWCLLDHHQIAYAIDRSHSLPLSFQAQQQLLAQLQAILIHQ